MNSLDNLEKIKQLDQQDMLGSIKLLPKQLEKAWMGTKFIKFPLEYEKIRNIVINGMGGSGIGPDIFKNFSQDKLVVPLEIIHSYSLPLYVDFNTLVILSSYSGETEEVLISGEKAIQSGAKITGLTTGSKLERFFKKYHLPYLKIDQSLNPCGAPRTGVGSSLGGFLGMFASLGLLKIKDEEIQRVVNYLKSEDENIEEAAKKLAPLLREKIPVIITAGFLKGNAHIFANQLNESSKTYSCYFSIPELNHHLMEGLKFPEEFTRNLFFVFLNSDLYQKENRVRFEVTKKVLDKYRIGYFEYNSGASDKLLQIFEILSFSSYASFYLSVLYEINPTLVPYIDFFKKELEQISQSVG